MLSVAGRGQGFEVPFAYPFPSEQVEGVARHLLELYLTLGLPNVIWSDEGGEFGDRCISISLSLTVHG